MIERKVFCSVLIESNGGKGENARFLTMEGGGTHNVVFPSRSQWDSYRPGLRQLQAQANSAPHLFLW